MNFISLSIRIVKDQYIWLKKHSNHIGESMKTIIRRALSDYRNNLK